METLLDIIKNISSSFIILLSFNIELHIYLNFTIQTIKIIRYLISGEILPKLTFIINICLNINRILKTPKTLAIYLYESSFIYFIN